MTMHLLPIYYNDNSTKKKKPFRKPGWIKAQAEHDKWLKARGVHPDQLKNKSKDSGNKVPVYSNGNSIPTSNYVGRVATKKTANQYTGDYLSLIHI